MITEGWALISDDEPTGVVDVLTICHHGDLSIRKNSYSGVTIDANEERFYLHLGETVIWWRRHVDEVLPSYAFGRDELYSLANQLHDNRLARELAQS